MIIQRGKHESWFSLPLPSLTHWARHAGVTFTHASPGEIPGRGIGLVATQNLQDPAGEESEGANGLPIEILTIPQDLVLSAETVREHAKFDRDLREVVDGLGAFGMSPRGAILTFLLFQASMCIPDLEERFGVHGPFTDYVKTLPTELLPTFWTPDELRLIIGTTLAPAIASKLRSLRREYELLCEQCAHTRWFRLVQDHLDFDDWLHVDAMFRSRALDFHGSCMIPGLDLASHSAGEGTNSFYDQRDDRYCLWLLRGKHVAAGEEVTISYGDEKGACEMIFSYGFLDEGMTSAETLFLNLAIPEEDGLRAAKMEIAQCAPGFKIIDVGGPAVQQGSDAPVSAGADAHDDAAMGDEEGRIDWKGDFVWLLCVDEDDGLRFTVAETIDGEQELQASFNGQEIGGGAADLRRLLAQSALWDVYRLRAVVILQQRVLEQLELLASTQEDVETAVHAEEVSVRAVPATLAMRLRHLEGELLRRADEDFERQKSQLANSPTVRQYLAEMNAPLDVDD